MVYSGWATSIVSLGWWWNEYGFSEKASVVWCYFAEKKEELRYSETFVQIYDHHYFVFIMLCDVTYIHLTERDLNKLLVWNRKHTHFYDLNIHFCLFSATVSSSKLIISISKYLRFTFQINMYIGFYN